MTQRWFCPRCSDEALQGKGPCKAKPAHDWPLYVIPTVRTPNGFALGSERITCDRHHGAWMKLFTREIGANDERAGREDA
jgi:hypothetical protein